MTQLIIFDIIMTCFKCETSGEMYNFYFYFFPASHKTILHEFFIFFFFLALVLIVVVKNIKPK